ncbi:hypothetical protein N9L68_04865, partial [bacterium]|nr:hypothetical protein [bacterium]
TVAPVDITIEALGPDQRAQGNTTHHTTHELLNNNNMLLVICPEDGVLSKHEYICQMSCNLICGNDGAAEMANVREQSRRWALTADITCTCTGMEKTNTTPATDWDAKLASLNDISNIMNADQEGHRLHFCTCLNPPRQRIVVQLCTCSFVDAHSIASCFIWMYV